MKMKRKRFIRVSGGPIKVTVDKFKEMQSDLRIFLMNHGFGLFDRGPIAYDFLTMLYGPRMTKRLFSRARKDVR